MIQIGTINKLKLFEFNFIDFMSFYKTFLLFNFTVKKNDLFTLISLTNAVIFLELFVSATHIELLNHIRSLQLALTFFDLMMLHIFVICAYIVCGWRKNVTHSFIMANILLLLQYNEMFD